MRGWKLLGHIRARAQSVSLATERPVKAGPGPLSPYRVRLRQRPAQNRVRSRILIIDRPTDRQSGRRPRFEPVVAGGHGAIWRVQDCPGEHLATLVDGLVQTAWWGVGDGVGPEGAVAQFGARAVMVRGGSWRAWCHIVRRRLGGCR
jgi:hypothetical protein